MASFKTHLINVPMQNNEKCVTVPIVMVSTSLFFPQQQKLCYVILVKHNSGLIKQKIGI